MATTFRFSTYPDIRRALQKVSNLVAEGKLNSKSANSIIYACQTALTVKRLEIEEERQAKDDDLFDF